MLIDNLTPSISVKLMHGDLQLSQGKRLFGQADRACLNGKRGAQDQACDNGQ